VNTIPAFAGIVTVNTILAVTSTITVNTIPAVPSNCYSHQVYNVTRLYVPNPVVMNVTYWAIACPGGP
jgi:hypothetical protein